MLDQLLARVRQAGSSKHVNIVAYSGGVDSSLVAALVHRVFPENSIACLGVSAALPQDQLLLARNVASAIGIPLWEARTSEGNDPRYVENKGQRFQKTLDFPIGTTRRRHACVLGWPLAYPRIL
ncbi:hypothetical protein DYB26_016357 [Aphanomyces astaci]|uniref:NAD/GMP synthase domain-containing protein n=1 Tax=Aphanomyces astaci TaxID=112090 RepID=A0A3R6Z9S3_APHAT|nr:hypothetical protein DYB26_016357 [Aphanomyces astaci]